MAWTVDFVAEAAEEFKNLDRSVQRRLQAYINDRISAAEDPRAFARALRGEYAGLWRFRIGSYRMICSVAEEAAMVTVLRIGHRRDVYAN